MTTEQITALATLLGGEQNATQSTTVIGPWEVGKTYFIQTVTWAYTGTLVSAGSLELTLKDAALIPDTGRFANALKDEDFSEVEPYPSGREIIIGRNSVVSSCKITKPQLSQK